MTKITERYECKTGGHNKFYEFIKEYNKNRFTVKGFYGAIGQASKLFIIYDGDDKEAAEVAYLDKLNEKLRKQYKLVGAIHNETSAKPNIPVISTSKSKDDMPVVWLMNAKGVNKKDNDKQFEELMKNDNYIVQEKLDGMRGGNFITETGLRIFSRNPGVDDALHPLEKTDSVPHLARLIFKGLAGTIFDSEIIVAGKDSAEIAGSINSTVNIIEDEKAKLYIFDLLYLKSKKLTNLTLRERLSELKKIEKQLITKFTVIVPYAIGEKSKRALYEEIMARGGEGIMFKNLDAVYDEGGRSTNNWYKFKKSIRVDCVITGFSKGTGKYNTQIGAVRFGQYINNKLIEIGQTSGMTDAVRLDMTKNPDKYIGHAVVIKGMERLKSKAIRHPQFDKMNDDKRPEDCKFYENEQ